MKVILASNSPRRKEILEGVGVEPQIIVSGADERSDATNPAKYAEDIALCKGRAVYSSLCASDGKEITDKKLIISADTVVVVDGEILGKPRDRADAIRMLTALSGKEHEVITGIALHFDGISVCAHEATKVYFDDLTAEEIERYADTNEPYDKSSVPIWHKEKRRYAWEDKAGGYGIQEPFGIKHIRRIEGDYYNVMGLPVHRLYILLKEEFGIEI